MRISTFAPSLYDDDSACSSIISALGADFFARLQTRLGGQEIKPPRRGKFLTEDHPLVCALGFEDAKALCEVCGGEQLYIPRGWRNHPQLGAVACEVEAGSGTSAIASKLGISQRHVRRLKRHLSELLARPGSIIAAD